MTEWDRCAGWLQAALDRAPGTYTLQDVRAMVESGAARFWPGKTAAAVTALEAGPPPTLKIWLAGGSLGELRNEMLPRFEAHARENGCRRVVVLGRKGWSRAIGYRPLYYVCAKELEA